MSPTMQRRSLYLCTTQMKKCVRMQPRINCTCAQFSIFIGVTSWRTADGKCNYVQSQRWLVRFHFWTPVHPTAGADKSYKTCNFSNLAKRDSDKVETTECYFYAHVDLCRLIVEISVFSPWIWRQRMQGSLKGWIGGKTPYYIGVKMFS